MEINAKVLKREGLDFMKLIKYEKIEDFVNENMSLILEKNGLIV